MESNIRKYREALRYVEYKEFIDGRDLVHDSYLYWYNKTGKDLFGEPMPVIVTILKYAIGTRRTARTFTWRGKKHLKEWYSVDDYLPNNGADGVKHGVKQDIRLRVYNDADQDLAIDATMVVEEVNMRLTPFQKELYSMERQGYNQTDTAEHFGMSPQSLAYHWKQMTNTRNKLVNGR